MAVVLVGERKDSQTYVRSKKKACEEVGIKSFGADLPESATEQEVLEVRVLPGFHKLHRILVCLMGDWYCNVQVVEKFNADPDVHGILVQLPLPKHINETRVLDAISIEKDVDGERGVLM